jgi:YD repeat-containing protein
MTHQRADSEQTEFEYDAAKRMSTLRHDAANQGPTVTQLRYDGRSFLDQSEKTWLPFPNERWTTQPIYDSSGPTTARGDLVAEWDGR